MKAPKRVLALTTAEHRLMIRGLLQFRNKLINQGHYTDAIDELLIKLQKKNALHSAFRSAPNC